MKIRNFFKVAAVSLAACFVFSFVHTDFRARVAAAQTLTQRKKAEVKGKKPALKDKIANAVDNYFYGDLDTVQVVHDDKSKSVLFIAPIYMKSGENGGCFIFGILAFYPVKNILESSEGKKEDAVKIDRQFYEITKCGGEPDIMPVPVRRGLIFLPDFDMAECG